MTTAANSHRLSYGEIIERLTEKRTGTTSVTIKMSAQGVIMPEVYRISYDRYGGDAA